RVGVADQAAWMVDLQAAENQWPIRAEPMRVMTDADAKHSQSSIGGDCSEGAGNLQSRLSLEMRDGHFLIIVLECPRAKRDRFQTGRHGGCGDRFETGHFLGGSTGSPRRA